MIKYPVCPISCVESMIIFNFFTLLFFLYNYLPMGAWE
jgi:hypothetical protein